MHCALCCRQLHCKVFLVWLMERQLPIVPCNLHIVDMIPVWEKLFGSCMCSDDDEFNDNLTEPIGSCQAVYAYEAKQYDELTIHPGENVTWICRKRYETGFSQSFATNDNQPLSGNPWLGTVFCTVTSILLHWLTGCCRWDRRWNVETFSCCFGGIRYCIFTFHDLRLNGDCYVTIWACRILVRFKTDYPNGF